MLAGGVICAVLAVSATVPAAVALPVKKLPVSHLLASMLLSLKLSASVESDATVVEVNVSLVVPTVSVVFTEVESVAELVWRTAIVFPMLTLVEVLPNAPPLIDIVPPVTEAV